MGRDAIPAGPTDLDLGQGAERPIFAVATSHYTLAI
jgi:hypothetical protein